MRTCSICSHPKRKQIEAAIAAGESLRDIAGQFNVSKSAIDRHKKDCIQPIIQQIVEERKQETAQTFTSVLDRMMRDERLIDEALKMVWGDEIKDIEKLKMMISESRMQNKLHAELTGELKQHINVTTSAEWQEAWKLIFGALEAYPDVQQHVVTLLEEERAKRRSA